MRERSTESAITDEDLFACALARYLVGDQGAKCSGSRGGVVGGDEVAYCCSKGVGVDPHDVNVLLCCGLLSVFWGGVSDAAPRVDARCRRKIGPPPDLRQAPLFAAISWGVAQF